MSEFLIKVSKTLAYHARHIQRGVCNARGAFTRQPAQRAIIMVGCSRAGTTLVYKPLSESRAIGSLQRETHDCWTDLHPLADAGVDVPIAGLVRIGLRLDIPSRASASDRSIEQGPCDAELFGTGQHMYATLAATALHILEKHSPRQRVPDLYKQGFAYIHGGRKRKICKTPGIAWNSTSVMALSGAVWHCCHAI